MLSIKKITAAGSAFRHIKRFRQIISILIKYGFGDILKILKIDRYLISGLKLGKSRRDKSLSSLPRPVRVRMALEELGPTFIKIGQLLSTRPDLVPLEFLQEIEKLQDNVATFPYEEVEKIISEETGKNINDIFSYFEQEALAGASIGQVHRAKLISGEDVVVKVRRPGIKRTIEVDLEIMYQIALLSERNLEELELHRPTKIIDEFARSLKQEIDFRKEASNINQFGELFKNEASVHVPKVYADYSSSAILIMEYINGVKANNIEQLKSYNVNLNDIADKGANLIMQQIFVHGFFHADPHPGNILIMEDGNICFLDFGMVGRISRKEREYFADLVMSLAQKDDKKVAESVLKLTYNNINTQRDELERDMNEFIGRHLYMPLKDVDLNCLIYELIDVLTRNSLCLKPHFYLMMKALGSIDGLARLLDPDFDIIGKAEPFVQKIQMNRLSPEAVGNDLMDYGKDLSKFLKDSPEDIRTILKQLKEGKLRTEFHHKGLEEVLFLMNRISNKISFAIILAAVIIGSSLIILSGIPPTWNDIPIFGLAGIVLSGIMGLILLITFINKKKF